MGVEANIKQQFETRNKWCADNSPGRWSHRQCMEWGQCRRYTQWAAQVQPLAASCPAALRWMQEYEWKHARKCTWQDEQKEDEQAQEVSHERLGLHVSAEPHLAELAEEIGSGPWKRTPGDGVPDGRR